LPSIFRSPRAIFVSLPYCADSNLIFLGITADHHSPFPVPRSSPFPVPRSPFPVPRSSPFPLPPSPFPFPRSPFPLPPSPFPVPPPPFFLFPPLFSLNFFLIFCFFFFRDSAYFHSRMCVSVEFCFFSDTNEDKSRRTVRLIKSEITLNSFANNNDKIVYSRRINTCVSKFNAKRKKKAIRLNRNLFQVFLSTQGRWECFLKCSSS